MRDVGAAEVSVIIVAFNSADFLAELLPRLRDDRLEVIVVDNHSSDDSRQIAAAAGATVVACETNTGWSRACNVGAARAGADVLAFVNPDAAPSADELVHLASRLRAEGYAALAPRFVDASTGEQQAFYFRFPTPVSGIFCFFGVGARVDEALGRPFMRRRTYEFGRELPGKVDQPGAACLLVAAGDFARLGGFDESMFLFFSDTDLCRRLTAAGRAVEVAWDVSVPHQGGGDVGKLDELRLRAVFQSDYLAYASREFGLAGRALTRFAVVVLSGLLPALASLLRGRPQRARQHLIASTTALRRTAWSGLADPPTS